MFARPQDFVRESTSIEILVPILGTHGGARLRPLDYFDESRKHKGGARKDPPAEQGPALPPPAAFARRREQERVAATRNERIPAEATEGRRPLKSEKGGEIGEPDAGLVKQSGGKCGWCLGEGEEEVAMIVCSKCSKDFHVECIKAQWAKYRDHFEWADFVCPYCRLCTGCGLPGTHEELDRLIVCKRCDIMYHQRCAGLLRKVVGPFLCADHVECRSCGTRVPGTGISGKWYLGHLLCDACGRLWLKDKYCPVCYKVYRNSELGLLSACATCGHQVHEGCETSDEARARARYACPACRGEVPALPGDEKDVIEFLWRLKDRDDEGVVDEEGGGNGIEGEGGVNGAEEEVGGNENEEAAEGQDGAGGEKKGAGEGEKEGRREQETKKTKDKREGGGEGEGGEREELAEEQGGKIDCGKADEGRSGHGRNAGKNEEDDGKTPEKVGEERDESEMGLAAITKPETTGDVDKSEEGEILVGEAGLETEDKDGLERAPKGIEQALQSGGLDADRNGGGSPAADSAPKEVRRRRTPSSKFKDMQVTVKRPRRSTGEKKGSGAPKGDGEGKLERNLEAKMEEVVEGLGAKVEEGEGLGSNRRGRSQKRKEPEEETAVGKRERRRSKGNND
ncbi:RING/FYVE/PHD-type zinc finger family protein [Klebsormidium nitens]|uniref:RING/FYVE/PHD-type zinc finger family protein n=1 Tax=Klebsormidium nitens TaxID=105231 RepID=A0A1Y1IM21_KLENI|nr:RING/FYVE/PHD-type zinc finger family protein [Klebsormidium nitens]|eukprot:GAQ90201.1 RING/FYVE/PHD-type zinc finger family protein [Klebsormidium nitens]